MGEDSKSNPHLFAYMAALVEAKAAAQRFDEVEKETTPKIQQAREAKVAADAEVRTRLAEMYKQAFSNGTITKQVIDVFAPTHDSTMCDEDDPSAGEDRCIRCFLLYVLKNPWRLDDYELSISRRQVRG
jgi:hypothetical protein